MRQIFTALAFILTSILGGCAGLAPEFRVVSGPIVPDDEPSYKVVTTFYATDRNPIGPPSARTYGIERSAIEYGTCKVSIPNDHILGALEEPSMFRLEFRQNPDKHVVLLRTLPTPKGKWLKSLANRVAASPGRKALLFVHGFRVTFEDAARRTAQMAHDLEFKGVPVFFSWPSKGTIEGYPADEENIAWAERDLLQFLDDFFARSEAQEVYLVAHSMGSRALTRTISSLTASKPQYRSRLREIILAAPDIDADIFKRDIVPALQATGRPVTLYSSSNDEALKLSAQFHGQHPRAGDTFNGLVLAPGLETIDASRVDTSLVGHSYYGDARPVLADISSLINHGQRPPSRYGLRRVRGRMGTYWQISP